MRPYSRSTIRNQRDSSAIIPYFAHKSSFFLQLGALGLNKSVLLFVLVAASFTFVGCGGKARTGTPPSGLAARVFASQSVSGPAAGAGLVIINGEYDILARTAGVSAGSAPGLMAISPNRATVLVLDTSINSVNVVNTQKETLTGAISLGGSTTSMVALDTGFGYLAVPSAPLVGGSPGAVEVVSLVTGATIATIAVPSAQTVVASPDGTLLLVFSADSDTVTVIYPLLVNTNNPATATVAGCAGCRPVYALFSSDGSTAYILNCGVQCGGAQAGVGTPASVQSLNTSSLSLGTAVPVDAATIGLISGSTLYVAGTSPTNNACTGETTAATTCGRLDTVDLGTMTVTSSVVITDGYHDRIDISANGQLFIGSHTCTTIGNVNAAVGEVRGCLSIFNTTNGQVVIPPDNGDVTGLQGFTTRYAEYVAEGGNLRVYDTTKDSLLLNSYITTGTIVVTGQIIDVKAVDFF
jgi:hypothetical protein